MQVRKQPDFAGADAPCQVLGLELRRVLQACGSQHLGQCVQCVAVEAGHPLGLVWHHQGALAQRILGRHAGRALVGVAALRLNAANGKHEAACRVDPVSADGQYAGNVEGADDFARRANADAGAQVQADQRVVHEHQAFAHWHAHVVAELARCRAGAAFLAIDNDEVRGDAGGEHGLGNAHEFPRVAQAELEAHGFAARKLAQAGYELQQLDRCAEGAVRRRRDAILAYTYATGLGNFGADLVPR
ncbi:hypothetical protein D3C79_522030 [compost metagenome]